MIYGIVPGSETLEDTGNGLIIKQTIKCDTIDIIPYRNEELPWYGDVLDSNPNFWVKYVSATTTEGGLCYYEVTYITDKRDQNTWCEESIDIGVEPVEDDTGYTWRNAGTPVVDPIPRTRPITIITLDLNETLPPKTKTDPVVGCVNDRKFRGVPAGYLLFDGVKAKNAYGDSGTIISSSSSYIFRRRYHAPWRLRWRPAEQARDATGDPIYWQNIDSTEPYYTTNPAKIATPVWVNQVPGWESLLSGTADWDEPIKDGQGYYTECDFATVLNLPIEVGDDAPGES